MQPFRIKIIRSETTMYEVVMSDGSKYQVYDLTLYEVFGELNYIKAIDGTYLNRKHILYAKYVG